METSEAAEERVRVTSVASIHIHPSNSANVIGTAHPGGEAAVASRKSDWTQIVDPQTGKKGWIHSAYLSPITENTASSEAELRKKQSIDVPNEEARTATSEPRPNAKKYRSKRQYVPRRLGLRSVLRRLR
jgi:SH3-like domain-containing protein